MNNEDQSELPAQPKKETTNPWFQWIAFLCLSTVLLYSLIFNLELDTITWLILAGFTIVSVPNKRFHDWLVLKWNELLEMAKGLLALGAIILVIGVVIGLGWWFLSSVGEGLSSIGGYDGMNAEEWADEAAFWEEKYNSFRNCVEDYDNFDIRTQIDYGGIFYYCE